MTNRVIESAFRSIRTTGGIKDPRVVACAIAVGLMFLDDLPESQYNTFHDPGAAAMLSIILANFFTLFVRRGWNFIWITFPFAIAAKYIIQGFFWVPNAAFWDLTTLIVWHAILGFLAGSGLSFQNRISMSLLSLVGVASAVFVCFLKSPSLSSWITFWFELEAARILIPCAFWTAILFFEKCHQASIIQATPPKADV